MSNLKKEDKAAYLKKLNMSSGEPFPDPFQLEEWSSDIQKLPDIC